MSPVASVIYPTQPDERFSEDCLYLNVWKPSGAPRKLPVIVWIHGGALMMGSSSMPFTEGADLARKGTVFVSINHRLGALGFLVLRELAAESPHHVSGNYGILDQIAALKWVRANIAAFGGDPNNVTVIGWSSGSASANALQASPLARGLFERAIGHSGSDMSPGAGLWPPRTVAEAQQYGLDYMKKMGAASLTELRAMPAKKLVESPFRFWMMENDGYVFPDEIRHIFAQGRENKASVMAGTTRNEGSTIGGSLGWGAPGTPEEKEEAARIYGPAGDPKRQFGDVVMWQQREWAKLNAQTGSNSYFWEFTREPPAPPLPGGTRLGAYHGADVPYAFGTLDKVALPWTAKDRELSRIMMGYWVNFARTGNPNGPGLPEWRRYDDDHTMEMSLTPHMVALAREPAMHYLDRLFAREDAEGTGKAPAVLVPH